MFMHTTSRAGVLPLLATFAALAFTLVVGIVQSGAQVIG